MVHPGGGGLTDFIVSKVAMSICALLVVSILAGVLGSTQMVDESSELDWVLREFCGLVDRGVWSGSESIIEWTVPSLSDGGAIAIKITSGVVWGEAGGHSEARQTTTPLHLWRYCGQALNSSVVRGLDDATCELSAVSGQAIVVTILRVLYENQPRLFAFAAL